MSDIHQCNQVDHIRDIDAKVGEMHTVLFGPAGGGGGFVVETRETLDIFRRGLDTLNNTAVKIQTDVAAVVEKNKSAAEMLKAWGTIVASVLSCVGLIVVAIIATRAGQPLPAVTP